jgi:NAD-dependent DNA ligase
LHNEDIIKKLDLHDGDFVYVEKGGEIIPKIVGVNLDNPYITYEPKYMETVWWLLKQLYTKDLAID